MLSSTHRVVISGTPDHKQLQVSFGFLLIRAKGLVVMLGYM